jgi:two-component system NtrC family sensor kinase
MASITKDAFSGQANKSKQDSRRGFTLPIATRLIASFLFIIATGNLIFTIVGTSLIGDRIVTEAQERVRTDLNSAREIFMGDLRHISDVVRLTAYRPVTQSALLYGYGEMILNDLITVKNAEGLDILTLVNADGTVILRTSNPEYIGDNQRQNEIITKVLRTGEATFGITVVSSTELYMDSPELETQARIPLIDTPRARTIPEIDETSGMVLAAAAPVIDSDKKMIGVLFGGVLLNQNYAIVDRIKHTVFQGVKYEDKDIGTATIFLDDIRISTNVTNTDGSRAIGTRVSEEVYNQVVINEQPWIDRAYVVNGWYIAAYEPIRDIDDRVIGILYVGVLEQKYTDIRNRSVFAFVGISLAGLIGSIILSLLISRSISVPVTRLVSASRELANGNLDVKVKKTSNDEIGELADAFSMMVSALKERDERLKDFTRKKVMESERLALVGQLSANVAHELNNPLQGIVTFSHLLLERSCTEDPARNNLQKIVTQANRCRDIIRGLLDFSRQRKPDKSLADINAILKDCVSLLEKQALFHNVKIILELEPNLPRIIVDASQIERVFINMIVNAADAMEGVGTLTITTCHCHEEDCLEIEITDTGYGIPEENLEKIFDPFFTTKETGHGVGLGLAISYGIIKEHKGSIFVESEVGKGTTFIVKLPFALEKAGIDNEPQV